MKAIEVSERLIKIAERVRFRTLLDVGTDHAYLPIFLCESGRLDFAVASDVNKLPLERAKANIESGGFGDKITARLGFGLSTVRPGEAETLVIAGMGGILTIGLLRESLQTAKSFKQIILQPQHDIDKVRKFLLESGFSIDDEEMLVGGGKYYVILDCSAGGSAAYSDKELRFGKVLIEKKDAVLKAFIKEEMDSTLKIKNRLKVREQNDNIRKRIAELSGYLELCGEVLACL